MSAFIVNNKTIDRILSFIYWNNGVSSSWRKRILKNIGYDLEKEEECKKLGLAMYKMNCEAVSQRYGEELNKKAISDYDYEYTLAKPIQVLKSLQCFLYQCSEGTVPREKLYKALRTIETSIMGEIISNLPEYEKAEWG